MVHLRPQLKSLAVAVTLCVAVLAIPLTSSQATPLPLTAPLTGVADPSGLSHHRAALTIKIDNTPQAHPQSGIDQADVVYEEIVEGQITRLAAIFNSHVPAKVGPVRSVRRTDRSIVWPIGGIFAYSGGAAYAVTSIKTAPVKLFDQSSAGSAMYRDPTRYAPHNLYAVPARLFAKGGHPVPPPAIFTYRSPYAPFVGKQMGLFTVNFRAGYAVTYHWNSKTFGYDRDIFGGPDYTTTHVRLSPKNVVVMWISYLGGVGTIGAEGQLFGTGRTWVFTNGRWIVGTWSHWLRQLPIVYRNPSGQIIKMSPGQTWVELINTNDTVSVH